MKSLEIIKTFLLLIFAIGSLFCIFISISKILKNNDYISSIHYQDTNFTNCTYLGFSPCSNKCDDKCNLCLGYNATLNITTYCYNNHEKINITKTLFIVVPLDNTNFCNLTHTCNYRCEDLLNSLTLSNIELPNNLGWGLLIIFSVFICLLLILFITISRNHVTISKDYERI